MSRSPRVRVRATRFALQVPLACSRLSDDEAERRPPIVQTTHVNRVERGPVVLETPKITEIQTHADVAGKEGHDAASHIDAEVVVDDGQPVTRRVDARSNEANATGHVRANTSRVRAIEGDRNRHVPI